MFFFFFHYFKGSASFKGFSYVESSLRRFSFNAAQLPRPDKCRSEQRQVFRNHLLTFSRSWLGNSPTYSPLEGENERKGKRERESYRIAMPGKLVQGSSFASHSMPLNNPSLHSQTLYTLAQGDPRPDQKTCCSLTLHPPRQRFTMPMNCWTAARVHCRFTQLFASTILCWRFFLSFLFPTFAIFTESSKFLVQYREILDNFLCKLLNNESFLNAHKTVSSLCHSLQTTTTTSQQREKWTNSRVVPNTEWRDRETFYETFYENLLRVPSERSRGSFLHSSSFVSLSLSFFLFPSFCSTRAASVAWNYMPSSPVRFTTKRDYYEKEERKKEREKEPSEMAKHTRHANGLLNFNENSTCIKVLTGSYNPASGRHWHFSSMTLRFPGQLNLPPHFCL